jgi:hypothetical protein
MIGSFGKKLNDDASSPESSGHIRSVSIRGFVALGNRWVEMVKVVLLAMICSVTVVNSARQ